MGFFSNLFGKGSKSGGKGARGHYTTCSLCSKPIKLMEQNMSIHTNDPDRWSIDGTAGYCPRCTNYLCSDHLFWRNTTGDSFGPWQISCKSCEVSVRGGP